MDILARLARNEGMTTKEALVYQGLLDCAGESTLFVLLNAVSARATADGLSLRLNLTRRSALSRRRRVLDVPPSEAEMGPVETYLRSDDDQVTNETHRIFAGAKSELIRQGNTTPSWEEIM